MRIPVHVQTGEVAGGRRATSSQPRRATASVTARLSSSHTPHPNSRASAARTNGTPREGLLFAPLSARSHKRKRFGGKLSPKPRNSR
jgi:hypothetical protein